MMPMAQDDGLEQMYQEVILEASKHPSGRVAFAPDLTDEAVSVGESTVMARCTGCAQWWPTRIAMPCASMYCPTSCGCTPSTSNATVPMRAVALMGPRMTGVGFLYGRRELLEALPPAWFGGSMVELAWMDKPAQYRRRGPDR